jgi:HAD superfamily hydrolase (TIGR01490 family)
VNLTLFDLDGTLIETDSDHAFGDFMIKIGWADTAIHREQNNAFYADYCNGTLDIDRYIDFATSAWRNRPEPERLTAREHFMQEVLRPSLHARAHGLVQQHRDAGDLIAIVTATNEFVTRPIADAFGIAELIAVELARDAQGSYTGRVQGIPSFREGKVPRVEAWLQAQGRHKREFSRVTVYSDSTNDLPLLEWATHPVATNPGPALAEVAQSRGWPVLHLFKEK